MNHNHTTATHRRGKGVRLTILDMRRAAARAMRRAYDRYMNWVGFHDDEAPNPTMWP